MEHVRIAILSTGDKSLAYMDNDHRKSMHYWDDELHEYLQGAANTYTFTVDAKHPDSVHITAGNKIAFIDKGKHYYLNIIRTERTEQTVTAEAWSLSFELINEDAGAYKAEKAMSFEEYLNVFDPEHSVRLGLNEVSDKRITNEWTGTTSILKRLFSLANVFSAEVEFETVLNKDYSLNEIVLNAYRKQSDKDSGIGTFRNDVVLRYGKGITGIRKTTDAENLYTCIIPTGKDGLTINGLDKKEYDASGRLEYFTDGAIIRAPQARDRFPSNVVNKGDAYIAMRKEYDTDSQEKLYSMALSDLKTASEPVVTYEVDGYFDTNIGDTVRMQDQEWNPTLYLQARVSEQVRSFTNPTVAKTVFTNYKELMSEISDDLLDKMQDLINKTKVYTCSIATNNGTIFKNGVGSTTLTAYAYNNGVDVSSKLQFRWSKDDAEFRTGRSVTVNAADVDTKAVYSFVAFEEGIRRGYYEVTITNVMDGKDGQDGIPGADGADGKTTYFHVKYSSVPNPTSSSQMTETPSKYIGTYVDFVMQDSTNPRDYTWSQFKGDPGENGIPGTNGQDGRTSYLHIAYANSSDGYTDFSTTNSTGREYMGQYVDYTERDSESPHMYKWSKIKGEDGTDGTIKSDTPPDDKTKLWYDTVNNVLKYWDGEKWVEAYTGDIEDAKDAAGNAQDSANTAISSVNNINTSFEKYKNEVRAEFKNTVTYVDGKTEVIDTWVRQGSDGVTPFLELGGTSNDLKARLTNSRLGFYEGDKGLAYFGNEKAYMPVAEVDNLNAKRVGVGNYTLLDNGDGHLSLIYIE